MNNPRLCTFPGCNKKHNGLGYCAGHLAQYHRTGKLGPLRQYMTSLSERFKRYVIPGGDDECWPWTGTCSSGGYGSIGVYGRIVRAHRVAWELTHGPIPKGDGHHGTCVLHTCDNSLCCNPRHLFLGTQADNVADMVAKGRSQAGETHSNAKLTADDVRTIRESYALGMTQAQLGRVFGVSSASINHIVARKTWRSVA